MVYLGILILVAAVGLLRLWLQHRREQSNRYSDMEGLKTRLERLATQPTPGSGAVRRAEAPARAEAPRAEADEPRRALHPVALPRVEPLEPARREAAKRRIEARRAARAG